MGDYTILSAAKFEAQYVIEAFEKHGNNVEYIEIGIGAISSAQNSASLSLKGKTVIYVGTCGVFKENFTPEIIQTDLCRWSPPSVRTGQSELIEGIEPDIEFGNLKKLPDLNCYKCLASPSITIDQNLSLNGEEIFVENLELYSVANKLLDASHLFILLGVTNRVWKNGRNEWKSNYIDVAKLTGSYIDKLLSEDILNEQINTKR